MEAGDIIRAIKVLQEVAPDDSTDMTLTTALIFLLISQEEGILNRELQDITGLSGGTVSNIVHTLSGGRKRDGVRRPGYKLVYQVPNNDDYRIKNNYLTDEGKKLIAKLNKL